MAELLIDRAKLTALLDSGASHSLIATNKIKVAVNKTKTRKVKNIFGVHAVVVPTPLVLNL